MFTSQDTQKSIVNPLLLKAELGHNEKNMEVFQYPGPQLWTTEALPPPLLFLGQEISNPWAHVPETQLRTGLNFDIGQIVLALNRTDLWVSFVKTNSFTSLTFIPCPPGSKHRHFHLMKYGKAKAPIKPQGFVLR